MTMIKCKECGNAISSEAKVCPHCGVKNKKPVGLIGWAFVLFFGYILFQCTLALEKGGQRASSQSSAKAGHISCDVDAANEVIKMVESGIGRIVKDRGDVVFVMLSKDWDYYTSRQKRDMVEAISNANACIEQEARMISFHDMTGRIVATVDPRNGIEMK